MKKRFLALLLILSMALGFCSTAVAEDKGSRQNRYNVVFVTDESYSMLSSDPDQLRYEAIRRFVALMAQNGNAIGSVRFASGIVDSQTLKGISGFDGKNDFMNGYTTLSPEWGTIWCTNIGLGISQAVEMIQQNADPANPSVIMLLTDGSTVMLTDEETEESLLLKADAVEQARELNIPIYTICLNADGSADIDELRQIAVATGGEFTEVDSARDLEDVQTMYYSLIFNAMDGDGETVVIGDSGMEEKAFDVPAIGVEEFNVVLSGNYTGCALTDPGGYTYSEAELQSMIMQGKDFSVIKAVAPQGGTWKVTLYGAPGTSIDFKLIYNSDFYVSSSISKSEGYKLGDKVTISATICDSSGPVTDGSRYTEFKGQIHIVHDGGIEEVYPMELGDSSFNYVLTLDQEGTYYAYVEVARDTYSVDTAGSPYEIGVNNNAPEWSGEEQKAHANLWPIIGGSAKLDLTGAAIDPDGDPITYSVESASFLEDDYTLDGSNLTVNNFSLSKGSFTIRATDPHGAFCTFDVLVTSTNIGLIMALAILLGILIVIVVLIVSLKKALGVPFMGTITVESIGNQGVAPAVMTPGRGRVKLETFGLGECGLPAKSYFQAGGKKGNIIFVSPKPIYSDCINGSAKKITINGDGIEVYIYPNQEFTDGIKVSFASLLNNDFGF